MKMLFTLFAIVCFSEVMAQSETTQQSKTVSVKILVDSINRALDRTYIFPEKSKVMADYLTIRLKQGAYKGINDPKGLADKLAADIQSAHKDGHLRVHYDPDFTARAASMEKQEGPRDLTEAIRNAKADNFAFKKTEILDGNIGYVVFTGFNGFIEESEPTVTAAFGFVANTDAIILDLRHNGGGSPWMVRHIASFFVKERTRLNDIYERRRNKTMEFWAEPRLADSIALSQPVYVLTGKGTFSAAEDFTYAMQVNKRAMIVGDTTGGGAHPTGPVDIGQGFVMDIPFARSINHITKTDWEGTGVIPDVPVPAEGALNTARRLILEAKLGKAKSEEEKKRICWSLSALKVHDYDSTVDATKFTSWAGQYSRFSITVKENELYLHDFNGRTFHLKPITPTLYLASDWLQVAFLLNAEGNTVMKFLGKPGWEDVYVKSN